MDTPPSPSEPPPPAYDAVQVEFDHKVSVTLETSLRIDEARSQSSNDGDQFEVWDESVFEENKRAQETGSAQVPKSAEKARLAAQDIARTSTSGQASSSASTMNAPLPLPHSSPPPKERPSWLVDERTPTQALPSGQGSSASGSSARHLHNIPPEDEYPNEQLPAFSDVDDSLTGPRYEEVIRQPARYPPSQADSPPESPLDSVAGDSYEVPPQRTLNLSPRRTYFDSRHYSVPAHSTHSRPPAPMRRSLPNVAPPPLMRFDPKIAYSIDRHPILPETNSSGPVEPASLYNSAVSSLMKTQTKARTPAPVSAGRQLPSVPNADNRSYGPQTYPNPISQPFSNPIPQTFLAQTQSPSPSLPLQQDPPGQNSYFPTGPQTYQPTSYHPVSQPSYPPHPPSIPFHQPYHQGNPTSSFYPSNAPVPPPNVPAQTVLGVPVPPPPPPPAQWQSQPTSGVYGGYGR